MAYNPSCTKDKVTGMCVSTDPSIVCYKNSVGQCVGRNPNPNDNPDNYVYSAGDACRTSYDCGAYASRGRLRDVDPWSPGANRGVIPEPMCRVLSGADAGQFKNCMDELDTNGGQVACANMDTSAGSDGECVYCPAGTECVDTMPDDAAPALSAFRMRTRMSMARFQ